VLLVTVIGVAAWLLFGRGARPALAFRERDFVLVADVANGTGEPVFDLALKSAIETDLRQSRYVNVFDPTQVQNTLRMMRLEPGTRLDETVGRDVCLRAGVRALVVPRILRVGEAYRVGASLVEPATGRIVAEASVVAQGREQVLLTAIDGLTRDVRARLGESLDSIARTDPPFAQYTTSSLEALELLDRGRRAWALGDHAKGERCFREALEHDPRFAAARGSLGLELIQFLGRPDEGRKLLAQALEEADQVSQREYLHLRAVNKQFVARDLAGALDDYRFISDLYPDEVPPYNNSGWIYSELGRLEEAAAMYDRAHEADPRSLVPLWNLWFLCTQRLKDPVRAERAGRALVALLPDNANAAHTVAFSLVGQRRFAEAEEGMRATLKLDPIHPYALPNLAHLLLRRGAAAEAVPVYREVVKLQKEGRIGTGLAHLNLSLGLALAAAGDASGSRRTILGAAEQLRAGGDKRPLPPQDEALLAAMLATAGLQGEARSLADRVARRAERDIAVHYELARAYIALGDRARATSHLEQAYAAGYTDPYFALIDPALGKLRTDPVLERLAPRGPHAAS
jgi:tetratricopeptide (TPR) repeat protein